MAVPKRKKSSSRSKMRRGSNGTFDANFPNVVIDKETGDLKLSHHLTKDGNYNGKKFKVKTKKNKTSNQEG